MSNKTKPANEYKKSLHNYTDSAKCVMDLLSILQHINISNTKQCLHEQIDNISSDKSIQSAYYNALPMDHILPEVVTQRILSFIHNNQNRTVSKEWNQHFIKNEEMYFRNKYQSDNKIDNDALDKDIKRLQHKMNTELKVLKKSFEQQIQKLKALSTVICVDCQGKGNELTACKDCGFDMCDNCLSTCDGDAAKICSECSLLCGNYDCGKVFCNKCFETLDQCIHCEGRFCMDCIEEIDDNKYWGPEESQEYQCCGCKDDCY